MAPANRYSLLYGSAYINANIVIEGSKRCTSKEVGESSVLPSRWRLQPHRRCVIDTFLILAAGEQAAGQKGNSILIVPPEHGQAVHSPDLRLRSYSCHDNTGPPGLKAEASYSTHITLA